MRFSTTAGAIAALALAVFNLPAAAQTAPKPPAATPAAAAKPEPAKPTVKAAPGEPTPITEPTTSYIIKTGDTLRTLGDKYFTRPPTADQVRIRNGARFERKMAPGLELIIPTRLLRIEILPAVIGAFKGDVTIAGGGTPGVARVGMPIYQGAVISTGGNAFVRIDLPDGSRISIPSQSRVRMETLHRVVLSGAIERTFVVEEGRTESSVAPITRPQDNYMVRTPVSVAAVRGTDFRVGYERASKAASTGVVEGTVGVDAPSIGSVSVPAAFGVGIKPGASLAVVPLLTPPTIAAVGRVQDAPLVTFDLDPVSGAKAARIQLASDAGMQEIFAEQTHPEAHFEFPGLANGDYFLRVTAIDPADIEGLPKVYAFHRDLNSIVTVGFTPVGAKGDRSFVFRWQAEGEGKRTYRVQVSKEPSAEAPLVDEGGLTDTQITLTNLPPGDYRWRVMSSTVRRDGLVEKWTPPQKFTIPAN